MFRLYFFGVNKNLPFRTHSCEKRDFICSPEGIRTLVADLRSQSPRPLDDGATTCNVSNISNPFGLLPNLKNHYLSVSPGVLVIPTSLNPGGLIGVLFTVTNQPKQSEN